MNSERSGIIFSLQRLSAHDGPGWRTLVFLKGCPLRCRWCSNPESWSPHPELAFNRERCIGTDACRRCLEVCPEKAVRTVIGDKAICLDRQRCSHCGHCADECPAQALTLFGKSIKVSEVLRKVEEDTLFYSRSQGGITLGGGEPLLQPDFAADLLHQSQQRGLHTAIETCGAVPWKNMETVCRHVDHIFYDIKSVDPQKHKAFTGAANHRLLSNLKRLCRTFPEAILTVRTPVITGCNDRPEDISAIMDWITSNTEISGYELLPYHRFGSLKYGYLGRTYTLADLKPPSAALMKDLKALVKTRFS